MTPTRTVGRPHRCRCGASVARDIDTRYKTRRVRLVDMATGLTHYCPAVSTLAPPAVLTRCPGCKQAVELHADGSWRDAFAEGAPPHECPAARVQERRPERATAPRREPQTAADDQQRAPVVAGQGRRTHTGIEI